jgi:hypothetical protein
MENLQNGAPWDVRLIDPQLQFSAAEQFCLAPPIASATIHSDLAVLRPHKLWRRQTRIAESGRW